jgi:hypothetical protein
MTIEYNIQSVESAEADVRVRYCTGREELIRGNVYVEWLILRRPPRDDDSESLSWETIAWCHDEATAERIVAGWQLMDAAEAEARKLEPVP